MDKEQREHKILEALDYAEKVKKIFADIVYENQEGQIEHFDKLNKTERIALVGCFNDAHHLVESLSLYQNWFFKK